jgi:hypothetical protein
MLLATLPPETLKLRVLVVPTAPSRMSSEAVIFFTVMFPLIAATPATVIFERTLQLVVEMPVLSTVRKTFASEVGTKPSTANCTPVVWEMRSELTAGLPLVH